MGVAGSREVVVDVDPVAAGVTGDVLGGRENVRRAKDEEECDKDCRASPTLGDGTRQCLGVSIRAVVQSEVSCHGRLQPQTLVAPEAHCLR